MGKLYGLSLFFNFIIMGLALGILPIKLKPKVIGWVFLWNITFYVGMGLFINRKIDFLLPYP